MNKSFKHKPYDLKQEKKGNDIYLIPKKEHTETIIWLHGLGDTAEGFLSVFDSEMNPCNETTKVVLLTAPTAPVTLNFGMSMPSWYDIRTLSSEASVKDFSKSVSLEEVERNSIRIKKVMEEEIKILGGNARKIFIGGFSQGCCMALNCGLSYEERIGGIIGMSGFYFPTTQESEKNADTPIFLCHGSDDPLIPSSLASKSYERLNKEKHDLIFHLEPQLVHSINMNELKLINDFFLKYSKI